MNDHPSEVNNLSNWVEKWFVNDPCEDSATRDRWRAVCISQYSEVSSFTSRFTPVLFHPSGIYLRLWLRAGHLLWPTLPMTDREPCHQQRKL